MWLQIVVMANKICQTSILPNLLNDLMVEQLVLQQKVFRKNEQFIKLHTGIKNWLKSDENDRQYPVEF